MINPGWWWLHHCLLTRPPGSALLPLPAQILAVTWQAHLASPAPSTTQGRPSYPQEHLIPQPLERGFLAHFIVSEGHDGPELWQTELLTG